MSKYIFYWVKNDLFGCFRNRGDRDKDNETGLKKGGGVEMSTTVLSIYAMHALFALKYLPLHANAHNPSSFKLFVSNTILQTGFATG